MGTLIDPFIKKAKEKNDRPLGMPTGSVRSIIALTTVGTLAYGFVAGLIQADFFEKVVLLVVGSYFASKIKK